MLKKLAVIVSQSPIIFNAVASNLEGQSFSLALTKLTATGLASLITSSQKIDLLIIDDDLGAHSSPSKLRQIKTIVNLTNQSIRTDEILLRLPLNLSQLLNIVSSSQRRPQLFININQWIYDEQLAILFDQARQISFTNTENDIFKYLVLAFNHQATKQELFKSIWHCQSTSSNTLETHLYRLKQKLPNVMQIKDQYCQLIITT